MTLLSLVNGSDEEDMMEIPLDGLHLDVVLEIVQSKKFDIKAIGLDFKDFKIMFNPEMLDPFSLERTLKAGFKGRIVIELREPQESKESLSKSIRSGITSRNSYMLPEIKSSTEALESHLIESERFVRSQRLAKLLKSFYGHQCMICGTFIFTDGLPYTESHHVIPLSEGGFDSPDNIAVVCPNCHTAFHHGKTEERERMFNIFLNSNPFIKNTMMTTHCSRTCELFNALPIRYL
jgi:5-methylcytosine-specific restriction endonuclease McrA